MVRHNLRKGVKHDLDALVGTQKTEGEDGRFAGRTEAFLQCFLVPEGHVRDTVVDEANPFLRDVVTVIQDCAGSFGQNDKLVTAVTDALEHRALASVRLGQHGMQGRDNRLLETLQQFEQVHAGLAAEKAVLMQIGRASCRERV